MKAVEMLPQMLLCYLSVNTVHACVCAYSRRETIKMAVPWVEKKKLIPNSHGHLLGKQDPERIQLVIKRPGIWEEGGLAGAA